MLITTDGLVTRSYEAGVNDRLIHIVTPERGRLAVMVKGGRSGSNKYAAIIQPFTYGNFELYQKGDMYWLRGGSVLTAFYELSCDVTRMALAAYLCDVASDMTDEGEDASELLRKMLTELSPPYSTTCFSRTAMPSNS